MININVTIEPKKRIITSLNVPGDKSISHRAAILGAISNGVTEISGFLPGEDCLATLGCFKEMGIKSDVCLDKAIVYGKGIKGLIPPLNTLDVKNSGTTLRLLTGLLSAQSFKSVITGDDSIKGRPMARIIKPLELMGAKFEINEKMTAPVTVYGTKLNGISYTLPVASAQVKSAILLAGLYSEGKIVVTEPCPTRDHTEIMLKYLGVPLEVDKNTISLSPVNEIFAKDISVPGDISSAAYFLSAGAILPGSKVTVKNTGINPTRTGILSVLSAMGAKISLNNRRIICGEEIADIEIAYSPLKGTEISGNELIPRLIDEIPVIAAVACFAKGTTYIKDASELKVKESDRIKTTVNTLSSLGADIKATCDGMIINGGKPLLGGKIDSGGDHRIAMAASIAALGAKDKTIITGAECVDISFPGYFELLKNSFPE